MSDNNYDLESKIKRLEDELKDTYYRINDLERDIDTIKRQMRSLQQSSGSNANEDYYE